MFGIDGDKINDAAEAVKALAKALSSGVALDITSGTFTVGETRITVENLKATIAPVKP